MRVICHKSFYKFYPETANDLLLFEDKFGKLKAKEDYYTYPALADLPDYSIKNQPYGGVISKINYADTAEQVFIQNDLKYDLESDTIKQNRVAGLVGERPTNYIWIVVGIPQAFSLLSDKSIMTGFEGRLNLVNGYTLISRWEIEDI